MADVRVRMLLALGGHEIGDEVDVPQDAAQLYIEARYVEPITQEPK